MVYTMQGVRKTESLNPQLAIFLFLYCVTFALLYISLPNPAIFLVMYALVVVGSIWQALSFLRAHYSPIGARLYLGSLLLYLTGFILWNIDNHLCAGLSLTRTYLSLPFQPLTQLHAWWHLLAGLATYVNILYCLHLRLTFLKRPTSLLARDWVGVTIPHA